MKSEQTIFIHVCYDDEHEFFIDIVNMSRSSSRYNTIYFDDKTINIAFIKPNGVNLNLDCSCLERYKKVLRYFKVS